MKKFFSVLLMVSLVVSGFSQTKNKTSTKDDKDLIKIDAKDIKGTRIGKVVAGSKITIQYVKGEWKIGGDAPLVSPDNFDIDARGKIALISVSKKNKTSLIEVLPEDTETNPFVFKALEDYDNLVIRMNDDARDKRYFDDNRGTVYYRITIEPPSKDAKDEKDKSPLSSKSKIIEKGAIEGMVYIVLGNESNSARVYLNNTKLLDTSEEKGVRSYYWSKSASVKAGDLFIVKCSPGSTNLFQMGILFISQDKGKWFSTNRKSWKLFGPENSKKWWIINDISKLNMDDIPSGPNDPGGHFKEAMNAMKKASGGGDAEIEPIGLPPSQTQTGESYYIIKIVDKDDL